ncbi:MAG: 50S ribosomal protein L12 [Candidatus Nanoarchaeia archaeon]|nr:50S ribosomal protein L12 [Candidatus Nanoarchaeia archaeon]
MELIYIAMLLHKAKKEITEAHIQKVVDAIGLKVENSQIKALVAALDGVDIDKAILEAAIPVASAAPVEAGHHAAKKEEHKEEDQAKKAEEAAAGLGALFG